MTTNITIKLTPDAGAQSCTFDGPPEYVTTAGDIILFKVADKKVHITMQIDPATGCTFDPANPFLPVTAYDDKKNPSKYSKKFSKPPALSSGNRQLEVDDENTGKVKLYYSLSFIGPNGVSFAIDPIIVNN